MNWTIDFTTEFSKGAEELVKGVAVILFLERKDPHFFPNTFGSPNIFTQINKLLKNFFRKRSNYSGFICNFVQLYSRRADFLDKPRWQADDAMRFKSLMLKHL